MLLYFCFRYEIIKGMVPESEHKMLVNIRKTEERVKKRKKQGLKQDKENLSDEEEDTSDVTKPMER